MPNVDSVRHLINAFTAASSIEANYQKRMLALCETPAPFSRAQFEPGHFTASAFVLSADHSSLLLIHHAKLLRWLQPGGHIEPGDLSLADAATREVMEECMLTTSDVELLSNQPFDVDIHEIPARRDEPKHLHFDVRFLYRSSTDRAQASDEVLDLAFVPLDKINERQSDQSVMRAVERLRSMRFD